MMRLKQIGMSLLFISVILGGDRIAIVTKVIGSVNYTRGNDASKSLKKGHIYLLMINQL